MVRPALTSKILSCPTGRAFSDVVTDIWCLVLPNESL